MSLPLRERGLKSPFCLRNLRGGMSLPLRERGLKSLANGGAQKTDVVAPLAGAWVEIYHNK